MSYYLGIDLGGTNIATGVVDENYNIIGRANTKTKVFHPAEEIADDMIATAHAAVADAGITLDQIEWVGAGSPGTVNPETGMVGLANNLGFHNVPLRQILSERIDKPVHIENDANAAAYGELMAGAGKGLRSMVMVTLGTGVGGGIVIDRRIYSGFNYKGGELGHIGMVKDGVPCTCGRRGCIEAYCSATALIRITREAMQLNLTSKMWELTGGSLDPVSGRTAFDAMRMGDKAGEMVVNQYIDNIASGISGIISTLQPEALVIGGGISKEGESFFGPIRERTYPQTFNHDPDNCAAILQAKLGNDAGIIGAALLGKQFQHI